MATLDCQLCRVCTMQVESPEHALLQCMLDRETVEWRQELREAVLRERNWDIPVSLSSEEALPLGQTADF
ncbi:hypothetical protein K435DRAFT_880877 [Dendrothele bispora CBS 962.96]|uniref:Uncharacterized protein n=1 Tax=Dendrothele bispora (strain CBS 962.96) TaxID=1314807 RepID=A0A4S8KJ22_DENBC|nr:hypothetical protein K435DRAFT_880877 [Dendrothele bispora CBS 962.96]